ncbi:hypothetical protein UWK_00598 [Desulfocapsa sulfexigens DSM 10523]|uniref:Uncharacterized protein n=2 Tax=Desulfocapsa TaxID=53318 RepID=M1NBJ6_DESSD|nr:hypothetical protein UWK_00598 [Desulfocapsa sulfexigens DSM 10523]
MNPHETARGKTNAHNPGSKVLMTTKKRILTCSVGDVIVTINRKMLVSEVISQGKEATKTKAGERACVSACRIMPNGQVLSRSPLFIDDWSHI